MSSEYEKERPRASVESLLEELRAVVNEADDLLRSTHTGAGERIEEVRARVEESLDNVKERLEGAQGLRERTRSAGKAAETYIKENPWTAAAIAIGIGYLVGRMGRRD